MYYVARQRISVTVTKDADVSGKWGIDPYDLFSATAARMSALSAFSLIFSSS